ncbi:Rieske 2Fe-2S domain-containing protein [Novosphingobium sp.]|uniref:Rieske 2Fe-2S domain-containing protein n=1 Tax=Novosphingobium sp. TaxID=1874826 RepID=UPI0026283CFC|nr:Rieske 2Fe-2S domain-containing protein [Novosphingobium sp.]
MTTTAPSSTRRDLTGTGYGRPKPTYIKELTEVGAGTPMGEYMRRYWHPVGISAHVKDLPLKVRILGEDLVLFRDGSGRAGALYERCAHRQASLFYGRIEKDGIRCCYHGWKFDVEGRLSNMPLETDGGKCGGIRQPWYPVEELYGLVFIYMGPPDRMPLLPRYECMEPLEAGEYYTHGFDSLPGATSHVLPTSWLIDQDNIHDMGHALWLHHLHSGPQFGPAFDYVTMDNVAYHQNFYDYAETPHGMYSRDEVTLSDGSVVESFLETHMPNVRFINPPVFIGPTRLINWCVPVDDESHYTISLARVKKDGIDMTRNPMGEWDRTDPIEVQRKPSDNEAQNSQGPIAWHSEEHLVASDRGMGKLRRQYMRELKALAEDRPLMNIRFDGEDPFIPVIAGAKVSKVGEGGAAVPTTPFHSDTAPVDASGQWTLTMNTPMGAQSLALRIDQAGSAFSGLLVSPDGEEGPFGDGAIVGNRLQWEARLTKPMPMVITFDMAVDGDTMNGTFKPGPFPAGPVTGIRV